ncbi:MAG: glycosyltransferase family 2 protein [Bacteroidetes bacterium]|nr:glycosyltransferase family 2 protein [Bacteroidota bacterium]
MKMDPLVSVIIPVYKVEKYIKKSVKSVLKQSYKNIEIILVNDGSPDKCPSICDKFALENFNISVIHKQNGGLSEARNFGITQAKGDYLLFLDSDDILVLDSIEGMVSNAIKYNSDMVIPDRYIQIDEATKEIKQRFHFNKICFVEEPASFATNTIIGKGRGWRATSLLYRASLIKEFNIEFPIGYIAEDIVFNLHFMAKANKLSFYESSTINYLKREGSITTSFQENLDKIFLFIDTEVIRFLKETKQNNLFGNNKRKELLCRNAIIYISEVFSDKCDWEHLKRFMCINNFLSNKRIVEAFSIKKINPFFDNKLSVIYFKMMFHLIKANNITIIYWLVRFSGFIKKFLRKKE